jgi:patatin-like phospholipase/acyl hydrolase
MFTDRRANTLLTRRERQPWPRGAPFKVLSLDGGGIRGIYAAELLRKCEEAFGAPLASYFDMIAGTSTGGIIALALALQIPAADIAAFYEQDGRRIFPPLPTGRLGRARRFFGAALRAKLDHEELESALKRRFGDRRLGESVSRLIIPAFMMPCTEIAVFKTDHHRDFRVDHATPMWRVARATSAAPSFLKGLEHTQSGKIFLDGGVWCNNPVMVAIVDVLSAYDLAPEQIEVMSIGTGNAPFQLSARDALSGWLAWRDVIKAAMFLTTDNATAQAKLLLGPERCLRLEPHGSAARLEMDDYDQAFVQLPFLAQQEFALRRDAIARFFAREVASRERHHAVPEVKPRRICR